MCSFHKSDHLVSKVDKQKGRPIEERCGVMNDMLTPLLALGHGAPSKKRPTSLIEV
jgi:hypothetical protein